MKKESPKVTIYIASFNCEKYIQEAIESVLTQTFSDWEMIIIDDNSKDNSWEIIERYKEDPRISIYKTTGLGLPGVCNMALSLAKGEYIVRLDGDDVLDENMLLILCLHLDQNPENAMVFPDWYLMNEEGFVFSFERREKAFTKNQMHDMPPNGACTMIRTELIRKVGGYREDLGAQDGLDIWTKLRKEYSYSNVNLPLFYYRRHGNNLTNNQQRIFYSRLEIKRDSVIEELKSYAPVIAVIPCRQMYDFAPNVWQQKIGEKSLLEIQLDLLQSINLFDHIIVTADSDQVLEVVEKYDNPKIKFFKRDVSLTYRSVPFYKTMKLILEKYDPEYRGISVVSYLETPFKSKQLVEESIFTLLMTHSDSAVAAEEIAYPVYQRQNSGLNLLNEKGIISSDFGKLYRELLTVNTFKNSVAKSGSLMGGRIANFSVPRSEGFCLDSKLSLEIANVIKGKVF